MFRRKVKSIGELVTTTLRENGMETPLLQRRLMANWATVVGDSVSRYTGDLSIRNQTLYVKVNNPALRADLSMMRTRLVQLLNESVGSMVIADVRFF